MYILPTAFHLGGCGHFITVGVHHHANGRKERLPCGSHLVPPCGGRHKIPRPILSDGSDVHRHIDLHGKWAMNFIYRHVPHGGHRTIDVLVTRIQNYAVGTYTNI